jgi:uncharacterized protein YbjT (DUF2867 family)
VGAGGYVGRLLVPALLAAGAEVRAVARRPETLGGLGGLDRRGADAYEVNGSARALAGAHVVVDLVPAPSAPVPALAEAAGLAGVTRLVALRCLTGEVRRGAVPPGLTVTTLRSAPVIGASSALLVTLRRLVERLPLLPLGSWIDVPVQPIAAGDLTRYLVWASGQTELTGAHDVGGGDVVTLRQMLDAIAIALGRRVHLAALPLELRRPSAFLLRTVAGSGAGPVRQLIERGGAVADDGAIRAAAPFEPMPFAASLRAALATGGPRRVR